MKERPILVRPELVRAILEGRKTQTRRLVKPQPPCECEYVINGAQSHALCRSIRDPHIWVPPTGKSIDHRLPCPYGKPGERLWVRETWCPRSNGLLLLEKVQRPFYKATDGEGDMPKPKFWPWRPSIHMPRWACRLVLEITAVRVERLQAISEEDAKAEGASFFRPDIDEPMSAGGTLAHGSYREGFQIVWESINGPGSWDANPWVWAIEFKKVQP